MINALDTFWNHYLLRMQTVNPTRQLMGYMDAQQWPPKTVDFDAFYLISLGSTPALGESIAVPLYTHTVQFVWMTKGTDINVASNMLGANRGNRVRTHWIMKEECVKGCWPYFARKHQFSVDAGQNVLFTPVSDPTETVRWTKPQFNLRVDKSSGLLYASASVRIFDMTDTINDPIPTDNAYSCSP